MNQLSAVIQNVLRQLEQFLFPTIPAPKRVLVRKNKPTLFP